MRMDANATERALAPQAALKNPRPVAGFRSVIRLCLALGYGEAEIFEPSDFGAELTPELRAQWDRLRLEVEETT